jgi:polysaccharide biosynthesis protein PslG
VESLVTHLLSRPALQFALLVFLCSSCNIFAQEIARQKRAFTQFETAIGDDYFDGRDSVARVRRHMNIARELGVKYLRFGFSWNGVEPEHGKYDFKFWDMLVDESERAGIQLIPYVAYTPEWAARSREQYWQQPPRELQWYAEMMKTLAARYRGRIHSWEIWNEPDLKEYWQGTADEFAELVRIATPAIRAGDPNAQIVLAGVSRGPSDFFRTLIEKHQVHKLVDVIAMHAYPESWGEERAETVFDEFVPGMRKIRDQQGSKLPLVLNEMGYADYRYAPNKASQYGTSVFYDYEHTPQYQANMLFKMFVMALGSGELQMAGWYRIDDFMHTDNRMPTDKVHYHLGVVDTKAKRKPAFFALKFFNQLFKQPVRAVPVASRNARGSQTILNQFETQDGRVIVAAWLRSSERGEVRSQSGMAMDSRRETIKVVLPCRASDVTRYRTTGAPLGRIKLNSNELRNVVLTGDGVFVAVATCAK